MPVRLHGASFVSFLLLTERSCGDILKGGNIGVLAGGRGVLGVYYLLENIIHYYYCQSEVGEDSAPSPPLENTLVKIFSFWQG